MIDDPFRGMLGPGRYPDRAAIESRPQPVRVWVVFPTGLEGPFETEYEADAWADRNNAGHGWTLRSEFKKEG